MKEIDMDYIFKSGIHAYQSVREVLMEDKEYLLERNVYEHLSDDVKQRMKPPKKNISLDILNELSKYENEEFNVDEIDELDIEMYETKYKALTNVVDNIIKFS